MSEGYPWPALSQLEQGSGRDNCYQASLGAYLLAAGLLDGAVGQHALLDRLSEVTRGTPDRLDNAETSWGQAAAGVRAFGLPWEWTPGYGDAVLAAWSIILVDGAALRYADGSAPYPSTWFPAAGPNHFVLWGPRYEGSYCYLMNPLDPAGGWAEYDLAAVEGSFAGAILLPPLRDARSGVRAKATAAGPLLRAPALGALAAIGPDRAPVHVLAGDELVLAGETWKGGYCRFRVPDSPAWGYFPVASVDWQVR